MHYASPSDLLFGIEILFFKESVQQGDPLGPLLFSLLINNAISSSEIDCFPDASVWNGSAKRKCS